MPNPFGLELGSAPSAEFADYHVVFKKIPNAHPDLKHYRGLWRPGAGLFHVSGQTEPITNDPTGVSARAVYEKLKRQLTRIYGSVTSLERIEDDAVWTGEREFIQSLLNSERNHFTLWSADKGAALDSGIEIILLQIEAVDYETMIVTLTYSARADEEAGGDDGIESL